MKKKQIKKPLFPQKCKIVILLKDGIVVAGDGNVTAYKDTEGRFVFTGYLVKDYNG